MSREANWAGNLTYRAQRTVRPTSIAELSALVQSVPRVKPLGSRHSFNDVADTDGVHVSLSALDGGAAGRPELDTARGIVRVPAGMRYGELAPWLQERGRALANLASLPHISVAGAVATGTHGSGERIGSLATQVAALELVTGTGEQLRLERGDEAFAGAVVGLGALGVVTTLELDTEPAFDVAQTVFEGARWDAVLDDFDGVQAAGDSVSLFTTWRDADIIDQVWIKRRADVAASPPDLSRFGARAADGPRHPLPGIDPAPCTPQQGEPGPWFERLPHFRLAFTPSAGAELQSEYLLPRADAPAAIQALRRLAPRLATVLQVCEVRTVAADDLWLSMASGAPAVAVHFTWRLDEPAVTALLPDLEQALPASARPHWGKLFGLPAAQLAARYPRWADFCLLRERLDPDRRFANAFLERIGL